MIKGNIDAYGNADNFIINADGGNDINAFSLPNQIQTAGVGSTEVTDDPGSHTLDVQSDQNSTWAVTVVSAP